MFKPGLILTEWRSRAPLLKQKEMKAKEKEKRKKKKEKSARTSVMKVSWASNL